MTGVDGDYRGLATVMEILSNLDHGRWSWTCVSELTWNCPRLICPSVLVCGFVDELT
jgi:hypothetical protein